MNYAADGTPSLCGEEEIRGIDGILLSHAHVDHYGYLGMLRPDIPILLCTGFSETMSEKKAASLGIKGFLLKPVLIRDLSQKIREVMDNRENL